MPPADLTTRGLGLGLQHPPQAEEDGCKIMSPGLETCPGHQKDARLGISSPCGALSFHVISIICKKGIDVCFPGVSITEHRFWGLCQASGIHWELDTQ